tara:strand:+ start:143 stop:319 length:177 start_codon:yes stop_codon:yes gene_type:complete
MQIIEEIPIELECWMLRNGIMPIDHYRKVPDVAWPEPPHDDMISQGWKPTFNGEQPPF